MAAAAVCGGGGGALVNSLAIQCDQITLQHSSRCLQALGRRTSAESSAAMNVCCPSGFDGLAIVSRRGAGEQLEIDRTSDERPGITWTRPTFATLSAAPRYSSCPSWLLLCDPARVEAKVICIHTEI